MAMPLAQPELVVLPSKDTIATKPLVTAQVTEILDEAFTDEVITSAASVTVSEKYLPIIQELEDWILTSSSRENDFKQAIISATSHSLPELSDIHDLDDYLDFLNSYLLWIPSENVQGKQMLSLANKLYFILNQPSVAHYQSPVAPSSFPEPLTWLSDWMVRYHRTIGSYMDRPESFTPATLATFFSSPSFHMSDYIIPRGGFRCFNDWFARHHKPGRRPVASIGDASIATNPADYRFLGAFPISERSTVTLKGLEWGIGQLLAGSEYSDRFRNGTWMHGFLNVDDYHRIHAPVAGEVVEARVIDGQNYSLVGVVDKDEDAVQRYHEKPADVVSTRPTNPELALLNDPGYQFVQTRGLVVIDMGEAGLVAVLPVAMIAVSSVMLTAEVGAELRKGEELGYFQFGGSDVVVVFEERQRPEFVIEFGRHYRMGEEMGRITRGV